MDQNILRNLIIKQTEIALKGVDEQIKKGGNIGGLEGLLNLVGPQLQAMPLQASMGPVEPWKREYLASLSKEQFEELKQQAHWAFEKATKTMKAIEDFEAEGE